MFSSPLGRGRRGGDDSKQHVATSRRDTSTIDDPVEEFHYLLDRLNCLMDLSRKAYEEVHAPLKNDENNTTNEKPSFGIFRRKRNKLDNVAASSATLSATKDDKDDSNHSSDTHGKSNDNGKDKDCDMEVNKGSSNDTSAANASTTPSPSTPSQEASLEQGLLSPPLKSIRSDDIGNSRGGEGCAEFISISEEEECIEIIRRVAELVIIAERVTATKIARDEMKKQHQLKKGWGSDITEEKEDVELEQNAGRSNSRRKILLVPVILLTGGESA